MAEILLYSKNHLWVRREDETSNLVKVGITWFARGELESVIFVNLPGVGDGIEVGKSFGEIEAIKTVSELISPVSGIITAINEEVVDNPELVNDFPESSWFVEAEVEKFSDELMDEAEYQKYKASL
jgi:glycine cleavage system H protein